MAHQENGHAVMQRVKADLATMANVDMEPKLTGRAIGMTLSPLPANKRVRKFSNAADDIEDDEEDTDTEENEQDDDS